MEQEQIVDRAKRGQVAKCPKRAGKSRFWDIVTC